jgi:hypothetical protein
MFHYIKQYKSPAIYMLQAEIDCSLTQNLLHDLYNQHVLAHVCDVTILVCVTQREWLCFKNGFCIHGVRGGCEGLHLFG